MHRRSVFFALLVLLVSLSACKYQGSSREGAAGTAPPVADPESLAVLLDGMGAHQFPITTNVPLAQKFFDQGFTMTYGFNHPGAERSFREAARLDPSCAMCWWGVALVLGPNINAPMDPASNDAVIEALERATTHATNATDRERDLIRALSARYAKNPPEDRSPLDQAYADAMRELRAAYPEDTDIATLFAEALMDLHPWDFWERSGEAMPWTGEIVETLEWVIAKDPQHLGAHHYYIHAVEASRDPGRALKSAEVLPGLTPGVGHLVHMPAHVYIRTGRYADASRVNEAAIKADRAYVDGCRGGGDTIYELAYMPHNWHFLWASTTFEGRSRRALEAARRMQQTVNLELMRAPGLETLQQYWATPMYAEIRFGKWEDILARPEPDQDLVYPRAV